MQKKTENNEIDKSRLLHGWSSLLLMLLIVLAGITSIALKSRYGRGRKAPPTRYYINDQLFRDRPYALKPRGLGQSPRIDRYATTGCGTH